MTVTKSSLGEEMVSLREIKAGIQSRNMEGGRTLPASLHACILLVYSDHFLIHPRTTYP